MLLASFSASLTSGYRLGVGRVQCKHPPEQLTPRPLSHGGDGEASERGTTGGNTGHRRKCGDEARSPGVSAAPPLASCVDVIELSKLSELQLPDVGSQVPVPRGHSTGSRQRSWHGTHRPHGLLLRPLISCMSFGQFLNSPVTGFLLVK